MSHLQESGEDPASKLIAEVMQFRFCLTEYAGLTNTVVESEDEDGSLYYGQGVRDPSTGTTVREGRGFLLSSSGSLYAGYFCDQRAEGPGALLVPNAEMHLKPPGISGSDSPRTSGIGVAVYTGYWEPDGMEGDGSIRTAGGYEYHGNWHKQFQEGYGTEKWPDGSRYMGHFKGGQKQGHGEFIWNSKGRFVGEFRGDKIWGFGTFEWNTGNRYEGEWQDNLMHGQGHFVWADGMEYNGQYAHGKKNGFGVLIMDNKYRWEGQWVNGKKEGKGVLYTPVGDRIVGTWKNDEWIESPKNGQSVQVAASFKNERALSHSHEEKCIRS